MIFVSGAFKTIFNSKRGVSITAYPAKAFVTGSQKILSLIEHGNL